MDRQLSRALPCWVIARPRLDPKSRLAAFVRVPVLIRALSLVPPCGLRSRVGGPPAGAAPSRRARPRNRRATREGLLENSKKLPLPGVLASVDDGFG